MQRRRRRRRRQRWRRRPRRSRRATRVATGSERKRARRAVTHALRVQSAQRARSTSGGRARGIPRRALRALPGNGRSVVRASRRPPPFAPRRGQKLPRTTVELCAFEPAAPRRGTEGERERGRERERERDGGEEGNSRGRELPVNPCPCARLRVRRYFDLPIAILRRRGCVFFFITFLVFISARLRICVSSYL